MREYSHNTLLCLPFGMTVLIKKENESHKATLAKDPVCVDDATLFVRLCSEGGFLVNEPPKKAAGLGAT